MSTLSSETQPPRSPAAADGSAGNAAGFARVVCTVPTYNEADNIVDLTAQLLALGPEFEVLVIDDNSPDGTWQLVRDLAAKDSRVHLLHRTTDRGRGASGREGFLMALEQGADAVIEMDADFSHPPESIPAMLARLSTCDPKSRKDYGLVLGSRGVEGGSDADRSALRQLITHAANLYIRLILGVPVRDCNSGFRAWRSSTLRALPAEKTFSKGPAIVQELLFKTARAGLPISEVGIQFVDRTRGDSTLTMKILLQGYTTVLKLRWMALCGRL